MGEIVTFYSYKGGVGRTMALANVAVLLSKWGYKTLIVDWDIEAPGLKFFFKEYLNLKTVNQKEGIIDLLTNAFHNPAQIESSITWQDCIIHIDLPESRESLHFLPEGRYDDEYFVKVENLNLSAFYSEKRGGDFIEQLRDEWRKTYDFVLIDSRTGITDIGGVCTIQLPDILVLLFTATDQGLQGVLNVAKKARIARQKLPFDRLSLLSIPIPSKFDSSEEFKISQEWLQHFTAELPDIYFDWLPRTVERRAFLEISKIPYIPYFSFGEKLPIIEQGTTDPAGIGYAYETLAALIANKLESVEQLLENRSEFVRSASKVELSVEEYRTSITTILKNKSKLGNYDVFLCHSSQDKPIVKEIGEQLKQRGILPWLDEWDFRPGLPWQKVLEEQIENIESVAVFIGKSGLGPWQDMEIEAFLRQFAKRKCPIIPVILPKTERIPELPLFLEGMVWVDFRTNTPDPLEQLIWGITGKRAPRLSDTRPIVFLAEATDDLYYVKEQVKRYLLQANLQVLPETFYSFEPNAFQRALRKDLKKSDVFVQFLSGLPGKKPPDLPQGYIRFQYETALEMEVPILQWCDPSLDIDTVQDHEQRHLLQTNTVLRVKLEEFEAQIVKSLSPSKAMQQNFPKGSITPLVFIDAAEVDMDLAHAIGEALQKYGVGYILPIQNATPSENREFFEEVVLTCDALIIVYGEVSSSWVTRELLRIRKISWKRAQLFTAFIIYDGPPEDKSALPIQFPGAVIITNHRNHLDEKEILAFIESLTEDISP